MNDGTLHVPARDIPVPASVSEAAQAILAMGRLGGSIEWPPLDDTEAWRAAIKSANEMTVAMASVEGGLFGGMSVDPAAAIVDVIDLGDFRVYDIQPKGVDRDDRRVYLEIHGGAFVFGAGEACKSSGQLSAVNIGLHTWSVDYRMPPDHPFPTPLDDCMAAYRRLLDERSPEEIVVGGGSAGGNLAAALVVRARDEGLPLPSSVVLETGAFDLSGSGDSRNTNADLDQVLGSDIGPMLSLYIGDMDVRHPYLSPLFADLTGFPPAILTTGTRDLLLSDNVLMHRALRAAGADAELHVWDAGSHGLFFNSTPEDADKVAEVRRFVATRCPA